jgi:flavin-dependent dehydrogenase
MEVITSNALRPATSSEFDLIVIGGGPAGTSAAITAARSGARVLLLERGKFPRQRVCGEFVSAESLELLAGLLATACSTILENAVRISKARLFFDGHNISAPVEPSAASIARFDLDAALWQAAEGAGAIALQQTTVESISGNSPFLVHTSSGSFLAGAVISASGRWSNLRSQPSRENDHSRRNLAEPKWLGLKAHFSESDPHPSVDLYFFDGGYCGVQPVRLAADDQTLGRVNACAMVRSDVAHSLPEVLAHHPQLKKRAQEWQRLTEPVATSPLVFREPAPVDDNILRVGDAAGFVDPFVGDGISLALRGGALAAKCLIPFIHHRHSLAEAARNYDEAYRKTLLPVFRNSSRLRRLLNLPRPLRRSVAHVLEAAPIVSRVLVRLTR